jgi:outer membrane protein OmpA-like peptidoglycan-associated protein
MDVLFMAQLGSRFTPPSAVRLFKVVRCGAIMVALGIASPSIAQAQVMVGGDRGPDVTIDQSVLDSLGPPLTLPQIFEAERRGTAAATTQKRATTRATTTRRTTTKPKTTRSTRTTRTAKRRVTPRRTAHHVARRSTQRREAVHLIPPKKIRTATSKKSEPRATTPPRAPKSATTATPSKEAAASEPVRAAPTPTAAPPPASLPQPTAAPPLPPPLTMPGKMAATQAPPATPETGHATAAPTSLVATQPSPPASPAAPAAKAESAVDGAKSPPVQIATATTVGHAVERVKFAPGATEVPPAARPILDRVATRLLADEGLQLQLIAHATGDSDDAMEARRVSLARAVSVRAYLIDKGVRSLRINVRALGNRSEKGPATDEVDLQLVTP